MLTSFGSAAASLLASPVSKVSIASAHSVRLSVNDINDALISTGLHKLDSQLHVACELNAAYAANSLGLCRSFTSPYACKTEEEEFHGDVVLQLDYTKRTLVVNQEWIKSTKETEAQNVFVHWNLVRDDEASRRDEAGYWKLVKQRIHKVPRKTKGHPALANGEQYG